MSYPKVPSNLPYYIIEGETKKYDYLIFVCLHTVFKNIEFNMSIVFHNCIIKHLLCKVNLVRYKNSLKDKIHPTKDFKTNEKLQVFLFKNIFAYCLF